MMMLVMTKSVALHGMKMLQMIPAMHFHVLLLTERVDRDLIAKGFVITSQVVNWLNNSWKNVLSCF